MFLPERSEGHVEVRTGKAQSSLHCGSDRSRKRKRERKGGDGWYRKNRERDDVTSTPRPIRGGWEEHTVGRGGGSGCWGEKQKGCVFPSLQHPNRLHPPDGMNREKDTEETENKACHRTSS